MLHGSGTAFSRGLILSHYWGKIFLSVLPGVPSVIIFKKLLLMANKLFPDLCELLGFFHSKYFTWDFLWPSIVTSNRWVTRKSVVTWGNPLLEFRALYRGLSSLVLFTEDFCFPYSLDSCIDLLTLVHVLALFHFLWILMCILHHNKPLISWKHKIKMYLIHLNCQTLQLNLSYLKSIRNTYISLQLSKITWQHSTL